MIQEIINRVEKTFEGLVFDPDRHLYTHKGNPLESVSSLIKNFVPEFDTEAISKGVSLKRGITQDEVKQEWEDIRVEACRFGTRVHDFAQRYAISKFNIKSDLKFHSVNQHLSGDEQLSAQSRAVIDFWANKPSHYIPIFTELQMFSADLDYAGTTDIVLLDTRDMTLAIGDYKTNKDIFKCYNEQRLLEPFEFLYNTPFDKFKIQLNLYDILLTLTSLKVSRRFVVWLKDDGTFKVHDVPNLKEKIFPFLEQRKIDANW